MKSESKYGMYMNKMLISILMMILMLSVNALAAQTKQERLKKAKQMITTALLSYRNQTVELDSSVAIVDVDSSIGNEMVADGRISDPYGTLKGCFLFAAYDTAATGGGSAIGILKNSSIVWLSDTFDMIVDQLNGMYFWGTLDLNKDKSVDIVISGGHFIYGGRAVEEYMWIFSWNGFKGVRINAVHNRQSVIDGEGIIIGDAFSLDSSNRNGVMKIISDKVEYDPETGGMAADKGTKYCWDGKLYDLCRKKRLRKG